MSSSVHRLHKETARDAGFGSLSLISVLAGVVTAYGAFAVIAAVAGAATNGLDVATDFRSDDWTSSGAAASAITAVVLFVAYLFGGYVAGRMARRSATIHGLAVFVTTLAIGAIVGGIVAGLADSADIEQNLRSIGVPTTSDQVSNVAIAGVVLSLAAVLIGSLVGASLGERWHTKLARRVVDPAYGPSAEAWDRAAATEVEAQRRLQADPALARDAAAERDDARDVDLREDDTGTDGARYTEAEWRRRDEDATPSATGNRV